MAPLRPIAAVQSLSGAPDFCRPFHVAKEAAWRTSRLAVSSRATVGRRWQSVHCRIMLIAELMCEQRREPSPRGTSHTQACLMRSRTSIEWVDQPSSIAMGSMVCAAILSSAHGGRRYDSKARAAVALEWAPGGNGEELGALDLSGGRNAAKRLSWFGWRS